MLLRVIIVALLSVCCRANACTNDADCNYNGVCDVNNSLCDCLPQFKGGNCEMFNFKPLKNRFSGGLRTVNETDGELVSSWGGSVLMADDGRYHMWASEMSYETGIKAWLTNSRIVHAVAENQNDLSIFTRKEIVWPIFSHEPTVSRAPTGEFVMFYTSNYGEKYGSQCAPPCSCGKNGTSCLRCLNDQQCSADPRAPLNTFMSYAAKPEGPWSSPILVPAPTEGDTNLACVIRSNSSITCLGRPDLGMLRGDHWQDVETYEWYATRGDNPPFGEDPMIWSQQWPPNSRSTDASKEILHAVTHGGGWGDPYGFHYFSLDGGYSWTTASPGTKVYENVVHVGRNANNSIILSRRERPHVVTNEVGQIVALTNGVTEAWPCTLVDDPVPDRPPCKTKPTPGTLPKCGPGSNGTGIWCPIDYCYTLWQWLETGAL